jgi:hypothetical protein
MQKNAMNAVNAIKCIGEKWTKKKGYIYAKVIFVCKIKLASLKFDCI